MSKISLVSRKEDLCAHRAHSRALTLTLTYPCSVLVLADNLNPNVRDLVLAVARKTALQGSGMQRKKRCGLQEELEGMC